MARAHKRKPKDVFSDNPMVPIDPTRFRALVAARGWTVQGLAKAVKCPSQTLDNLGKGDQPKTTRASRRQAIAAALEVSEGWLAGTEYLLASLGHIHRELTLPLSPRMQLEVHILLDKVSKAYSRDRREILGEEARSRREASSLAHLIQWGCLRLLRLDTWREQLTTWRRPEPFPASAMLAAPGMLADPKDLYTDEEDAVGLAMITVFTAVLRPWFDGQAKLDYNRLRVLIGYDRLGDDPLGASHPLYLGKASSPEDLEPVHALGWPVWVKL